MHVKAYIDGFRSVMPKETFSDILDPNLPNVLIQDEKAFDAIDLQRNAIAKPGLTGTSIVQWFWELLSDPNIFTEKRLRLLLQFTTGDRLAPVGEFRNLAQAFRLSPDSSDHPDSRLTTAATCFNRLNIPIYSSKDIMMESLILAIESMPGFLENLQ